MVAATLILGAYLIGSVASAIVVCRVMGLPDPRAGGSGNPGATNVLRLGGKKAAAITLAGDVAKGLLPVLVATALGASQAVIAGVAVAAFLGHLYPLYFRFQGGKGVATAFGVVAGISPIALLGMGATWLVVALVSRYSSLSSLLAGILAPLYTWLATESSALAAATAFIAVLMVWRHRGNVARLLGGNESRIGQKSAAPVASEPEAPG